MSKTVRVYMRTDKVGSDCWVDTYIPEDEWEDMTADEQNGIIREHIHDLGEIWTEVH